MCSVTTTTQPVKATRVLDIDAACREMAAAHKMCLGIIAGIDHLSGARPLPPRSLRDDDEDIDRHDGGLT
jgi:hypothetical protein